MSIPEPDLWLEVDAVRMSQVIGNLLHNAAKFTRGAGRIAIAARRRQDVLEIEVADEGMGIAPEMLPVVFELFAQGDRTLARSQGGLGIGLSLVKGLVEMHGGTVEAKSPGPGQGSTFTIRLPLATLRAAPPPAVPGLTGAAAQSLHRVLIVEDNLDSAEAMQMLLSGMGHEVVVANDGRAAPDVARAFQPDVILLDIGLPGIDGYELAKLLRAMPETRAARLIAVSGYGQQKDRARSLSAGFDLHLVKPVDPARLNEAINDSATA